MKRTIIILSIVFSLSAAGILYGNHGRSDAWEAVLVKEAYAAQFPEQMPDSALDPMVDSPQDDSLAKPLCGGGVPFGATIWR